MTTLAERMDNLPTARRKNVEERANALIAEEGKLRNSSLKRGAGMTEGGCPVHSRSGTTDSVNHCGCHDQSD